MYQDVLVNANSKYDFLGCLHDAKRYLPLTDKIVNRIDKSTDKCLEKSREIYNRIMTR